MFDSIPTLVGIALLAIVATVFLVPPIRRALQRARSAGFNSYVLPQADDLPMENRREDILIIRP